MKKDESVSIISEGMECTKKSVEELMKDIDKAVEILSLSLEVEDKVKLGSYIILEKTHVEETTHRNPRTSEEVISEAHDKLKMKSTQAFKDLIR